MESVILHIGPVKTGSTFIQDLLWRYRDDLARQGVQHPCSHDNEMWFAVNDVQDCANVQFDFPECRGSWASIVQRVMASERRSILSHEVMGFSTDEHIRRIANGLSPRPLQVIVHARSLAGILPSTFQEKVKMVDPDISWDDWLARQRESRAMWCDAATIVSRWARYVPVEQIHVVTVPPAGSDPQLLLSRFADAAGIDTRSWSTDHIESNASLDTDQTELLRLVNRATEPTMDVRQRRSLVNQGIIPRLGTPRSDRKRRISHAERAWIEAETDRRIASLASCGARIHGDLADLGCPEDSWTEHAHDVDQERLTKIALHALIDACTAPSHAPEADGRV